MAVRVPKLYQAIADFHSGQEGDLSFRAGQFIAVHDEGDGPESWWEGEIDGRRGVFPGTYVRSVKRVQKTFTAPEDQDPTDLGAAERRVRFDFSRNEVADTFHRFEYDRQGDFDPMKSQSEWELEEAEEKLRMMFDRWNVLERNLPPGTKCEERIAWEKEQEKKQKEEEAARQQREDRKRRLQQAREARRAKQNAEGSNEIVAASDDEPTSRAERLRHLAETRKANQAPASQEVAEHGTEDDPAAVRQKRIRELAEARERRRAKEQSQPQTDPAPAPDVQAENGSIPAEADEATKNSIAATAKAAQAVDNALKALDNAIESLEEHINGLDETDGYVKEFKQLDKEDRDRFKSEPTEAGSARPDLNRYGDILPYDDARFVLNPEKNANSLGGYINASHLKNLLPGSPHYIAAQGPNERSVGHFWKMVAQSRCRLIIMVTNVRERGRVKCEEYWPTESSTTVEFETDEDGPGVRVKYLTAKEERGLWWRREFELTELGDNDAKPRKVIQLQFVSWPDHGVPAVPVTFVNFLHTAMSCYNTACNQAKAAKESKAPPMIVHCSAGVGRSGVFCLVYSALTYLPYIGKGSNKTLDIFKAVSDMRKSRRYMVQTVQQYKFCYTTILHATKFYRDGSRQLRKKLLEEQRQKILESQKRIQRERQSLEAKKPQSSSSSSSAASSAPTSVQPSRQGSKLSPLSDSHEQDDGTPVWQHPKLSQSKVEALLLKPTPEEGRFLVYTTDDGRDQLVLAFVHEGQAVHAPITKSRDGTLAINRNKMEQVDNITELVDQLRLPQPPDVWPIVLAAFVPRKGAHPEAVQQEQEKARFLVERSKKLQETAAMTPPNLSRPASAQSLGSRSDLDSSTGSGVFDLDTGTSPRKGRRSMKSRFSVLMKRKNRRASGDTTMEADTAALPVKREFNDPASSVLHGKARENGETVRLSGRTRFYTFINGVYVELKDRYFGHPAFKLREPIDSSHGHLEGLYVFLYYDLPSSCWVIFLPSAGVVALCDSPEQHPLDLDRPWKVLDHQNQFVPDEAIVISKAESGQQTDVRANDQSDLETEIAQLRSKLQTLERQASRHSQTETSLKTSHDHEKRLEAQVTKLRVMLTSRCTPEELAELDASLASAAPEVDEVRRLREERDQLQRELEDSAVVEEELRSKLARLELSDDGLQRRLTRLEALNQQLKGDLDRARAREAELSHELAETKVRMAVSEEHNARLKAIARAQGFTLPADVDSDGGESSAPSIEPASPPKKRVLNLGWGAGDVDDDEPDTSDSDPHRSSMGEYNDLNFGALLSRRQHKASETSSQNEGNSWKTDDTLEGREYVALRDHDAESPEELSFVLGDLLTVFGKAKPGWFKAELGGERGLIPEDCIRFD